MLLLQGACVAKSFLNGLVFREVGTTASGTRYYEAKTREPGVYFYMYHDPDCNGGSDGSGRWVIDNDKPSTSKLEDLDGDEDCEYLARLNSDGADRPPETSTWRMYCNGGWEDKVLSLVDMSPKAVASRTPKTTAKPELASALLLNGLCDHLGYLNKVPFQMQGTTESGAPYYKARKGEFYIYYDPDCDGGPVGQARWILDSDQPSLTRTTDLDNDRDCKYLARIDADADSFILPKSNATWLVYCKSGWVEQNLTLTRLNRTVVVQQVLTSGATINLRGFLFLLIVLSCAGKEFL